MRNQWSICIAALLTTIIAGGVQFAAAWEPDRLVTLGAVGSVAEVTGLQPGRLAALTARQGLRSEVCIALADGQISRTERYQILADARRILKPEEYPGFKRYLDRVSPPKTAPARHPRKAIVAAKQTPVTASQNDSPTAETEAEVAPLPPVPST